jgi:uncharacterized protein (DUF2235 family)
MGKNIVVFSDGTGQKGGVGSNTNVYKLFNMITDRSPEQIAFYDPGLGTDWKKVTGNISGRGISKNILDCYRFIFENYESGDNLYLFGFSRGAATVRSLSAFIELFGILPKSRSDLIDQAFKIYKIRNDKRRDRKAKAFIKKHHTMWCRIEFLGVWDTVAALGFPIKSVSAVLDRLFPHHFHSFELSEAVNYARQALSIDEERKTFHPALWNKFKDDPEDPRVKQVWFCGVHTDIGGGYAEDGLSNITLKWMIKEATDKGLLIYPDSKAYKRLLEAKIDPDGTMHNEIKGIMGKIYRREQRTWDKDKHGEPIIHESVKKRTKSTNNEVEPKYLAWITGHMSENEKEQRIETT